MAEIKQLPRNVADQISAGEVIERPASVVKELVENSIDAESSNILIEVDNGGKDSIRVLDNGCGISSDQLELAFSRYATSKISDINDIYSLSTLGFRGEALASIASVARVEIKSRIESKNKGHSLIIKGSEVEDSNPCGCRPGTDINVTELFFNTPARYKYLKTTGTEFGHISKIVYREAIAHPEIKFTLKHNKRTLIKTPGTGKVIDCLHNIYGSELTDNLLPEIEYTDRFVTVKGYIARPGFNRSSRQHEIFVVNNRPIHNMILNYAVEEAYRDFMKSGNYPVVFLFIELNPVLIDVNVHPTKRKVKFSRRNIIKDIIKKGLRKVLKNNSPAARFKINNTEKKDKKVKRKKLITENNFFTKSYDKEFNKESEIKDEKRVKGNALENYTDSNDVINYNTQDIDNFNRDIDKDISVNTNNNRKLNNKVNKDKDIKQPQIIDIMGQIHNSYIIVVIKDGFLVIDQHAAHERILYEKIEEKYNNSNIKAQQLLIPVNIELTLTEVEIINKYRNILQKLGFSLEPFGTKSFIIREVPLYIKYRAGKDVIKEIIDKLLNEKKMEKSDLIKRMILYMSCRGAIKAGEKLEKQEINKLVQDLFNTSNPYHCPHGRPSLIHISEKELMKGLGRI